jgi:hypothetical protein
MWSEIKGAEKRCKVRERYEEHRSLYGIIGSDEEKD